jgi:hypothetical protein
MGTSTLEIFWIPRIYSPKAGLVVRNLRHHCGWASQKRPHQRASRRSASSPGWQQMSQARGGEVYLWNRCLLAILHRRGGHQKPARASEHGENPLGLTRNESLTSLHHRWRINLDQTPSQSSRWKEAVCRFFVCPDIPIDGSLEVAVAGSAVKWLRDSMGLISNASEVNALAESVPNTGGVYFVTAFSGLLAPYWDPRAAGLIIGWFSPSFKHAGCFPTENGQGYHRIPAPHISLEQY